MGIKFSPEEYAEAGREFKKVKNMSQSSFLAWLTRYYQRAYRDGWTQAMDANGGVVVAEGVEANVMDPGELREALLSVRGIGKKRADAIIARLNEKR